MPTIYLSNFVKAPVEVVFNLSRSVDLHKASMTHYKEEIIAGVSAGLVEQGDTVTWKAKHFFKSRKLKVTVTELMAPTFFADEMLEGDFQKMRHEHYFKSLNNGTVMVDSFCFESPFGFIGKLVNIIFLEKYMTRLLMERNKEIKRIAETNLWKQYLT
jgi:ligand-binding SRPBCC domain-containing protein